MTNLKLKAVLWQVGHVVTDNISTIRQITDERLSYNLETHRIHIHIST